MTFTCWQLNSFTNATDILTFSTSQIWGNGSLVGDNSSVWCFTRSGRLALPKGLHSRAQTEPTCFRYNRYLWGHGSNKITSSLQSSALHTHQLLLFLKFLWKKKGKKKPIMILSVLVFDFGTNHIPSVIKHLWFPFPSSIGGRIWQSTRENKLTIAYS